MSKIIGVVGTIIALFASIIVGWRTSGAKAKEVQYHTQKTKEANEIIELLIGPRLSRSAFRDAAFHSLDRRLQKRILEVSHSKSN